MKAQTFFGMLLCTLLLWQPRSAQAWGEEGHAIVALIADHYLQPSVRAQVNAILAGDHSGLTADTSMASEASWADHYRDGDRDGSREHYLRTRQWHYIDIELDNPDVSQACFGFPPLAAGVVASQGTADDCIVNKIAQFSTELQDRGTSPDERRLALQFLLHLVGDLHQPLHAGDEHDQGGNREHMAAAGLAPQNLHRYWDTEFVAGLGTDPAVVAGSLLQAIGEADTIRWQSGAVSDWAFESSDVARRVAYAGVGPSCAAHDCPLSAQQVGDAVAAVRVQLQRAGVRLALVLNRSLQ
jgi:S1/P1 Nuclease